MKCQRRGCVSIADPGRSRRKCETVTDLAKCTEEEEEEEMYFKTKFHKKYYCNNLAQRIDRA
jgi:hypothetical protein